MEETKLKDICEFIVDCPHSTAKDEGCGYPLIRTPNVGKGRLILQGVHRVNEQVYKTRIERATPSAGDIILAREAPVGNAAIIMPGQKVCLGQRVVLLRAKKEIVNPMFLVYYLLSNEVQHKLKNNANGAVVAHLNMDEIRNLALTLPSIGIQDKIATILSSIDDKIEVNRRINDNFVIEGFFEVLLVWMLTTPINDNLEQQAQALFKSWFVDFEPFRNQPFVESELGMIPQGWQVGTLAEITQQKSEKVGQQEDVKVLSPVTTGKLMLSEEYFTKQVFSESIAKYKVVEIGDFAYNPARVNIGSIGRNEYGFRGCVSPVYIVFSCKDGYDYFFDLFRKTEKFQTEVKARAIGGVRQSLNYTDFGFIQTVIAPTDVMKKFNPFYEKIQAAQKHLEEENSRLSSLRDALLPRLMSGELSVKEIVNM